MQSAINVKSTLHGELIMQLLSNSATGHDDDEELGMTISNSSK